MRQNRRWVWPVSLSTDSGGWGGELEEERESDSRQVPKHLGERAARASFHEGVRGARLFVYGDWRRWMPSGLPWAVRVAPAAVPPLGCGGGEAGQEGERESR